MPTYSTPNYNNTSELSDTAKNWDYLGSIHQMYMLMMYKYSEYMASIELGNSSVKYYEWKISISTLRYMVYYQFDKYLTSPNNIKTNITPEQYDKIMLNNKVNEVKDLMAHLIYWCQSDGIFKLEVDKNVKHHLLR
jgi:hypothetical protein